METTTIEISIQLARALDDLAARAGRSRAAFVEQTLGALVAASSVAREEPGDAAWPQSFGMLADAEISGATFEEWLVANRRLETMNGS